MDKKNQKADKRSITGYKTQGKETKKNEIIISLPNGKKVKVLKNIPFEKTN